MANAKKPVETPAEVDPWKVKETIFIPLIPGQKDQPDVPASVNGRMFLIQRGVRVDVPAPIAEVVNRSIEQEMKAQKFYYSKSKA